MSAYEKVSFENRQYLGRWISINGKSYLTVDDSIEEKIREKRRNKRAMLALQYPNLLIYTSVDIMFGDEDKLRNYAEMQLIEQRHREAV